MNILPFVMTMLMLLSIMTYARIESFRDLSGLKAQFEWYMQKNARKYNNQVNDRKYETTQGSKNKIGDDPKSKQKDEERACSRLPFALFINKQQREGRQEIFDQHYQLAKLLMERLYSDAKFYQEIEQRQPDFLDTILGNLMSASEKLPKGQRIISAADLASIDLGNDPLNDAFYRMLHGTVEIDDQDIKRTYPALTRFITVKSGKNKVRVFLAPRDILMTLYDNPDLVKEIEETRQNLYQQVKDDSISAPEASSEFESQFGNKQRTGVSANSLDFRVSKSNPKDYK